MVQPFRVPVLGRVMVDGRWRADCSNQGIPVRVCYAPTSADWCDPQRTFVAETTFTDSTGHFQLEFLYNPGWYKVWFEAAPQEAVDPDTGLQLYPYTLSMKSDPTMVLSTKELVVTGSCPNGRAPAPAGGRPMITYWDWVWIWEHQVDLDGDGTFVPELEALTLARGMEKASARKLFVRSYSRGEAPSSPLQITEDWMNCTPGVLKLTFTMAAALGDAWDMVVQAFMYSPYVSLRVGSMCGYSQIFRPAPLWQSSRVTVYVPLSLPWTAVDRPPFSVIGLPASGLFWLLYYGGLICMVPGARLVPYTCVSVYIDAKAPSRTSTLGMFMVEAEVDPNYVVEPIVGDASPGEGIGVSDLTRVADRLGALQGGGALPGFSPRASYDPFCDFDQDGVISIQDLARVGLGYGATGVSSSVPNEAVTWRSWCLEADPGGPTGLKYYDPRTKAGSTWSNAPEAPPVHEENGTWVGQPLRPRRYTAPTPEQLQVVQLEGLQALPIPSWVEGFPVRPTG